MWVVVVVVVRVRVCVWCACVGEMVCVRWELCALVLVFVCARLRVQVPCVQASCGVAFRERQREVCEGFLYSSGRPSCLAEGISCCSCKESLRTGCAAFFWSHKMQRSVTTKVL